MIKKIYENYLFQLYIEKSEYELDIATPVLVGWYKALQLDKCDILLLTIVLSSSKGLHFLDEIAGA